MDSTWGSNHGTRIKDAYIAQWVLYFFYQCAAGFAFRRGAGCFRMMGGGHGGRARSSLHVNHARIHLVTSVTFNIGGFTPLVCAAELGHERAIERIKARLAAAGVPHRRLPSTEFI